MKNYRKRSKFGSKSKNRSKNRSRKFSTRKERSRSQLKKVSFYEEGPPIEEIVETYYKDTQHAPIQGLKSELKKSGVVRQADLNKGIRILSEIRAKPFIELRPFIESLTDQELRYVATCLTYYNSILGTIIYSEPVITEINTRETFNELLAQKGRLISKKIDSYLRHRKLSEDKEMIGMPIKN